MENEAIMTFKGIEIFVDDRVPLTRTLDDGTVEAISHWEVDGRWLMHSQRLMELEELLIGDAMCTGEIDAG